jgi:hypothetical protein
VYSQHVMVDFDFQALGIDTVSDDESDGEQDPGEATPEFKVKAKAILLTYNELPYGIDIERVRAALESSLFIGNTIRWSICLERGSRVHIHAYLESRKQYHTTLKHFTLTIPAGEAHEVPDQEYGPWPMNKDPYIGDYVAVPSDCQSNTTSGSGYRPAANRGHFYVQCRYKNTHIAQINNYEAGHDFSVKTEWMKTLWDQQKIDDDRILPGAGFYRCCTPALEGLVRHSVSKRRMEVKAEKRVQRINQLAAMKNPHRTYSIIEAWREQYNKIDFRYKFLILWGPTRTGKTELARSLFDSPFEHRDSVCWTGYDEDKHDGILFDDVKLVYSYVSENRSLYQAGGWVCVHTSPTNQNAIDIDVTQKPIVITTNAQPLGDWILGNAYVVHIDAHTWLEEPREPPPLMGDWTTPIPVNKISVPDHKLKPTVTKPCGCGVWGGCVLCIVSITTTDDDQ